MNPIILNELESAIATYLSLDTSDDLKRAFEDRYTHKDIEQAIASLLDQKIIEPQENGKFKLKNLDDNFGDDYAKGMQHVMGKIIGTHDPVTFPKHYNQGNISVADFIADQSLSFDRGSCVKYLCRAGIKEDPELSLKDKTIQDLKKAIWYLNHEIDWVSKNGL